MKFSAQTTQNFNPVSFYIFVRGVEASLLIGLSLDHAGSVQDLARGIVFCSQAGHFILTEPLANPGA